LYCRMCASLLNLSSPPSLLSDTKMNRESKVREFARKHIAHRYTSRNYKNIFYASIYTIYTYIFMYIYTLISFNYADTTILWKQYIGKQDSPIPRVVCVNSLQRAFKLFSSNFQSYSPLSPFPSFPFVCLMRIRTAIAYYSLLNIQKYANTHYEFLMEIHRVLSEIVRYLVLRSI
jgi:hypothetical protein